MWFISHSSTSSFCLLKKCIDFFFVLYYVTNTEFGWTCYSNRLPGIFRQFRAWIQCKNETIMPASIQEILWMAISQ